MSAAPTIVLDGKTLNEHFAVSDLRRPFPEVRSETEDVPGMDGTVVVGQTFGPRQVSLRLWAHARDHGRMMDDFAWLVTLLGAQGPHSLAISDEGGRVRSVYLDGQLDFDEYEEHGSVLVSLVQPDPWCDVGPERSVAVPSGGSASFVLSHARPRLRVQAASAVRDATSLLWGVRFDGGDFLRVAVPTGSATAVSIDCHTREVRVAGVVAMVTLTSDWPELGAGPHTVEMDVGTGAATLTWQERRL